MEETKPDFGNSQSEIPPSPSSDPAPSAVIELHDAVGSVSYRGGGDVNIRARSSLLQPTLDSPILQRQETPRDPKTKDFLTSTMSFLPDSIRVPLVPYVANIRETIVPSLISLFFREKNPAAEIFIKKKPLLRILFSSTLILHGLLLLISIFFFGLIQAFNPTFFEYSYFFLALDSIFASNFLVIYFWGAILAGLIAFYKVPTHLKAMGSTKPRVSLTNRVFLTRTAHVLIQAVAEELGHHGFYIGLAMAGFSTFAWFIRNLGFWVGIGVTSIGVVLIVLTVLASAEVFHPPQEIQKLLSKYDLKNLFVGCTVVLALGLSLMVIGLLFDSLFAIYWEWIMFPLLNATSLWRFDNLWNGIFGPEYIARPRNFTSARRRRNLMKKNKGFIIGFIVSNLLYRDGTKLHGVLGVINAWYVGLALMNATLRYGLFTAILARLVYELEFIVIGFLFRKFNIHSKRGTGPVLSDKKDMGL